MDLLLLIQATHTGIFKAQVKEDKQTQKLLRSKSFSDRPLVRDGELVARAGMATPAVPCMATPAVPCMRRPPSASARAPAERPLPVPTSLRPPPPPTTPSPAPGLPVPRPARPARARARLGEPPFPARSAQADPFPRRVRKSTHTCGVHTRAVCASAISCPPSTPQPP